MIDDRHEKSSRFTTARLRARHQIAIGQQRRNGIFLHRRWRVVASKTNILHDPWVKTQFREVLDRRGDLFAGRFDRNVVVLFKIDATVRHAKQLAATNFRFIVEKRVTHVSTRSSRTPCFCHLSASLVVKPRSGCTFGASRKASQRLGTALGK